MGHSAHFIQQQTQTLLEQHKRAWDLFLYWMDQSDDEAMTTQKKQEFLDCLEEEAAKIAGPAALRFPANPDFAHVCSKGTKLPQCG